MTLDRMLALAVAVLRLPPEAFWRMGTREWLAILAGLSPSIDRGRLPDLDSLMATFPDE